jgi:hypothetical protein
LYGPRRRDWLEKALRQAVPNIPRPLRLFLHLLKIVPREGLGTARSMGVGIACCIVMCHRLKQSRIATKRFGSQSPIQSFLPHALQDDGSRSPQQIRGGQQDNGCRCARHDATALTNWSHTVSFENLHSFCVETNQCPSPPKVRLFDARSSRMIGKLESGPRSSVMVAL